MALLFVDGFDHYNPASQATMKGWGTNFAGSVTGRSGRGNGVSYGYNFDRTRYLGGNYSSVVIGIAIKCPSLGVRCFGIADGTSRQLGIECDTLGRLTLYRGSTLLASTSNQVFFVNAWTYVELKATIHNTSGSYEVRVNGVTVLTGTGDTQETANAYVNTILLDGPGGGYSVQADDLYVCSADSTPPNDFMGDIYIETLYPNADDVSGWTPSTGSTRYACIDETPVNSDTDYVYSDTVNDAFACQLTDLPASAWQVKGVQLVTVARKDDAGSRIIVPLLRVGTTNYEATQRSLGDSYVAYCDAYANNPATGNPWSVSEVNNLKVGARVVS